MASLSAPLETEIRREVVAPRALVVWTKRLRTAADMLCHVSPEMISKVSVTVVLGGEAGEAESVQALSARLDHERELATWVRAGERTLTVFFARPAGY